MNGVIIIKKLLEDQLNITVTKCGFVIDSKCSWLGCCPDRIVLNFKIVEIKYPLSKNNIFLTEACDDKKIFHEFRG